uniref:Uncharacterized protein n=1 Tax=Moumouvirus sp. 'Monve' TaxID=1128131 RepID=H2ED34_9VIRU|nr:hypothetical protein mv_R102 [Moumouvirus Monve]
MDQFQDSANFVTETIIPTLMFLAYNTILQTQNGSISKYILASLPDTINLEKQREIHQTRDSMIIEIIEIVSNYPGAYVFGGFHRDFFAKMSFKDIDIRFVFKSEAICFIDRIQRLFNIKFLKTSYNSKGCFTLCIQNMYNKEINIYVDLTYDNDEYGSLYTVKFFDFDVNMLMSSVHYSDQVYLASLKSSNPHCHILDILDNCAKKQFIILDYNGRPEILHKPSYTATIDSEDNIIKMKRNFNFTSHESFQSIMINTNCINYHTVRGKKLLLRKKKMESRGWTCLNEECSNPVCIMAPFSLREKHKKYCQKLVMARRKQLEKEAKIRERELLRQKKNKEIKPFGYIPGFISVKMVNKNQFTKHTEAKEIHVSKKKFLKQLKKEEKTCGKTRKKYRSKRSGKIRYDY